MQAIRRHLAIYAAIAGTAVKSNLAYSMWVWADFFVTIASMFIFVYFWRAVYSGTTTLGGGRRPHERSNTLWSAVRNVTIAWTAGASITRGK